MVITGAASGIGAALAIACVKLNANVFIADKNGNGLRSIAEKLKCNYQVCDVSKEYNVSELVREVQFKFGHIDLFCSNAGVFFKDKLGSVTLENKYWEEAWQVNMMSHVYAARYALPQMIERQSGYFLQIISAAALLSQIGAATYSATKSAAMSFAESIAISYGRAGIKVSAACPQYVATPMLGFDNAEEFKHNDNLISADEAALRIMDGVLHEKFLILTDPNVISFFERKCKDYDRWIKGMQNLRREIVDETGEIDLSQMPRFI